MATKPKKKAATEKVAVVKRVVKNGVRQPLPDSIAGRLWAICDNLRDANKNVAPARFEYRKVVSEQKEKFNHESVSFQFFQWRKFHGIKARATGKYPSRGSFEVSARTLARQAKKTAPKKKAAVKPTSKSTPTAASKVTKAKVKASAKKAPKVATKKATKKAAVKKVAKKAAVKKANKAKK